MPRNGETWPRTTSMRDVGMSASPGIAEGVAEGRSRGGSSSYPQDCCWLRPLAARLFTGRVLPRRPGDSLQSVCGTRSMNPATPRHSVELRPRPMLRLGQRAGMTTVAAPGPAESASSCGCTSTATLKPHSCSQLHQGPLQGRPGGRDFLPRLALAALVNAAQGRREPWAGVSALGSLIRRAS
jgi:hypothetical protein